jgi:class 3 adenylate cyclase/HAMP domain-containing protein
MSLRKLIIAFIIIIIPLSLTIIFCAIKLNQAEIEVERAQEKRFVSYQLAEELIRSSELLTRFARTYIITGDVRFKRYFRIVLAIRNGQVKKPSNYSSAYWDLVIEGLTPEPDTTIIGQSLESSMLNAGITLEEFSLLKDAQSTSNELSLIENSAFNVVDENGKLNPSAVDILFDQKYHQLKAKIMQPISTFLMVVNKRTSSELRSINERSKGLLILLLGASVALFAAFIIFATLIYARIIKRGEKILVNVKAVANGDYSSRNNIKGEDELSILATSIDHMTDQLSQTIQSVKEEVDIVKAQYVEVNEEKYHSEKLLSNILPVLIADRLKKGESNIAETFPEVTVLFADIVGFTQHSAQLAPRQLVSMLNDIFGRFDELTQLYRLEKIKTIGDCYMVVGGVPDRSPTHCQQVADFAIAAQKSIRAYALESNIDLHIRIGFHTGTVVAGIVGKQKYSYDLWGDVVNTASRMESAGISDKIHVTEAVRVRLADDYTFIENGIVDLKGKGPVKSFILVDKKLD